MNLTLLSLAAAAVFLGPNDRPERPWTLLVYGAADNNADGDAEADGPLGPTRVRRSLDGYTPLEARDEGSPHGGWSFLRDGATPDNGRLENWFELLDSWFDDTSSDPGGLNRYRG